jgi:hypothetical protein
MLSKASAQVGWVFIFSNRATGSTAVTSAQQPSTRASALLGEGGPGAARTSWFALTLYYTAQRFAEATSNAKTISLHLLSTIAA